MRKIQFEKTIKTFDEFNEEQQEEIINNYRFINVEFNDWNDYILSDFIESVKEKTNLEIESKNITWAVGDRNARFGVYSKNIINELLNRFADKGVYDIDTTDKLGSFLNHMGGGICNQNHTELGIAEVYFEDDTEQQAEQNKAVKEQINTILDEIITLCSEYHNKNEEAYNYSISNESVKETIKANEYEFDEDTLKIC